MADQKHERLRGKVPKQARSRQTLSRLLDAAEALLSEEGAEGATVPAIARRAGVSVGVIYRRFSDKDDLLRAVYERFFHRIEESNAAALMLPVLNTLPPERLVRGVVTGMVVGYRHYRGILRALTLYAQNHPDAEFRRHAEQLSRSSVPHLVAVILRHRRSIGHPDPDAAVPFALMTVAWILRGVLLEDESWHTALAPAGSRLEEELVRIVLKYLDVQDEAVASPFDAIHDAAPAPAPEEGSGRRSSGEGAHD
jgi:AcrR family transcriptional regulator